MTSLGWFGGILGVLSLLLSLTLLARGATKVGISVDEPIHMDWFRRFGGTFVTDLDYGQVSWVYTHLFNVLFGIEVFGDPTNTAEAYIGRHVAISVLSLLAVWGVAGIVFQVTHSKAWALTTAVFLTSTPIWLGHSMFNPKDIPVAVGFTIYSFALVLMIRHALFREQSL